MIFYKFIEFTNHITKMRRLFLTIAVLAIACCVSASAQENKPRILPFKISESEVSENFKKWADEQSMAPNDLKKTPIGSIEAIYMPYIAVSANTTANYKGEQGYEHKEKVRNNYGEYKDEYVTSWRSKKGTVSKNQVNVLASGFPDSTAHCAEDVAPWDFDEAEIFSQEKLQPYTHYVYDPDTKVLSRSVEKALEEGLYDLIKKDIGGQEQRINSVEMEYADLETVFIYMPIYKVKYTYDGEEFSMIMNGQTGKGHGESPKSGWKQFLSILCGGGVLAALLFLIKGIGGRKKQKTEIKKY